MREYFEATKMFMFVGILILIVLSVSWALWPVQKTIERKVLVNSHQYQEGMADRASTLRASLAEINSRLNTIGENEIQLRNDLLAQKATITVQLNAIRR